MATVAAHHGTVSAGLLRPVAPAVQTCYSLLDIAPLCGVTDFTDGKYVDERNDRAAYLAAQFNQAEYLLDQVRCRAGTRLLDVGCGYGRILEQAAARGAAAIGITISPQQVARCLRAASTSASSTTVICHAAMIRGIVRLTPSSPMVRSNILSRRATRRRGRVTRSTTSSSPFVAGCSSMAAGSSPPRFIFARRGSSTRTKSSAGPLPIAAAATIIRWRCWSGPLAAGIRNRDSWLAARALFRAGGRRRRHRGLSPHQRALAPPPAIGRGVQSTRLGGNRGQMVGTAAGNVGNAPQPPLGSNLVLAVPRTGADAALAADLAGEMTSTELAAI